MSNSFTVPVESKSEPRPPHIREGETDWNAVAQELKKHPNQWRLLDIEKYRECPLHRAKYAGARLRRRGLSVDYHQHYDEHQVPDPKTGEPTPVRQMLGTYSIHVMYVQTEKDSA